MRIEITAYNHEKFSFVITRFEDLFCGVTEEPKKNTKADKKNKRNIVILAFCCKLTNELDSMKWKKIPDFVYLFRTWKFDLEYLLFHGAYIICEKQSTVDILTSYYLFQKRFKSYFSLQYWNPRRIKRIIKSGTLFWRTSKFSLIAIRKQN